MADSLRIVLLSYGAQDFELLHMACVHAGHTPVAYGHARSRTRTASESAAVVTEIVTALPKGIDLIVAGSAGNLAQAIAGYAPDLIVSYCFPWKLPRAVLDLPRLGAVNIHSSLLPRYRGPIPVHWAIRNGDPELGVTVHWMDEDFDTGEIIVAQGGIAVEEDVTADQLFGRISKVIPGLLTRALDLVSADCKGVPQDSTRATYAGWMEPAFMAVDWSNTASEIHNQVRTFRFATAGARGPIATVNGELVEVLQTKKVPSDGLLVTCADDPLWIVDSARLGEAATPIRLPWIAEGRPNQAHGRLGFPETHSLWRK